MIPYRRRIAGMKRPGLMKQLDWIAGGGGLSLKMAFWLIVL